MIKDYSCGYLWRTYSFGDAGRIIDPENPSTKNNPFLNYNTMIINSGISEKEVLNSFKDLSGKPIEKSLDAPRDAKKTKRRGDQGSH